MPSTTGRPVAPSRSAATSRALAGRALLASCDPPRVGQVLGVSRRTLGRIADADSTAALQDAARGRGGAALARGQCPPRPSSTAEERDAADAWLRDAQQEQQQVTRYAPRALSDRGAVHAPGPSAPAQKSARTGVPQEGDADGRETHAPRPSAPGVWSAERDPADAARRARAGGCPDTPATAHSPSQRAHRLCARGREAGRPDPHDE